MPTLAEAGVPGYENTTWHGWLAPGGTPPAIVNRLSAELAKAGKSAEVISRLTPDGGEPVGTTPEQFRQFIATDVPRWRKVVKEAGIKLE